MSDAESMAMLEKRRIEAAMLRHVYETLKASHGVQAAQRAIAQGLITDVTNALAGKTVASIKAAGYQWIGDGAGGGYQHYVNWTYYGDGIELNPARIESIVVKDNVIVSGMYILNPGKTMANVPTLAGPLTTFHDHQNLCFSGTTLVDGVLSEDATRTDPDDIDDHLAGCAPTMLDPDGNGDADPLTDGMLILRRLFGFSGIALTAGAVDDALCARCDADAIEPWIDSFLPVP